MNSIKEDCCPAFIQLSCTSSGSW